MSRPAEDFELEYAKMPEQLANPRRRTDNLRM